MIATKRIPSVGQEITYYQPDGEKLFGKVTYVWSLDKVAVMVAEGFQIRTITSVLWLLPEAVPPANQPYVKP